MEMAECANIKQLVKCVEVFGDDAFKFIFVFEVLVGANLQFVTGFFVAGDYAVGMHL